MTKLLLLILVMSGCRDWTPVDAMSGYSSEPTEIIGVWNSAISLSGREFSMTIEDGYEGTAYTLIDGEPSELEIVGIEYNVPTIEVYFNNGLLLGKLTEYNRIEAVFEFLNNAYSMTLIKQ